MSKNSKYILVKRRDVARTLGMLRLEEGVGGARCPACKAETPRKDAWEGKRNHTRHCFLHRLEKASKAPYEEPKPDQKVIDEVQRFYGNIVGYDKSVPLEEVASFFYRLGFRNMARELNRE